MEIMGRCWIPECSITKAIQDELTVRHEDKYGSKEVILYERFGNGYFLPRRWHFLPGALSSFHSGGYFDEFSSFPLREEQPEACEETVGLLHRNKGTILVAECGRGKTVMGIEVARRLRRTTLVLVHKSFLMDQWKDRLGEFLPEARVGTVHRDVCDFEDKDFVIAMTQSLLSKSRIYPEKLYTWAGLVITDEVHRFAALTWHQAISLFSAEFRLGLTATEERRDKMEKVFLEHIGPVGYRMKSKPARPTVSRVNLGTRINAREYTIPWNGEVNSAKLITMLTQNEYRNKSIVDLVSRSVPKGRISLVLSDRRKHLDSLEKLIVASVPSDVKVRQFVGGMKKSAKEDAVTADIILSTYKMSMEALDLPYLDTLFLATPRVNIVQPVGRILREEVPDKNPPAVIDFVDSEVPILLNYWFARRKLYKEKGYLP
jgi:superfamily II DNA or RNA helicase